LAGRQEEAVTVNLTQTGDQWNKEGPSFLKNIGKVLSGYSKEEGILQKG
jgi:hypothetical protein